MLLTFEKIRHQELRRDGRVIENCTMQGPILSVFILKLPCNRLFEQKHKRLGEAVKLATKEDLRQREENVCGFIVASAIDENPAIVSPDSPVNNPTHHAQC